MNSEQHEQPASTVSTQDAPRDCGGCNVCCTAMRVAPLDKSAGTPCPHQTSTGCGIYLSRPSVCRVWFCMWVRDAGRIFTNAQRPDKLGLFFTASTADPISGEQTIYAHETIPHAAQLPQAIKIIRYLQQVSPVQIIPAPGSIPRSTPVPGITPGIALGVLPALGAARLSGPHQPPPPPTPFPCDMIPP